jgi:hypothetical protein
MWGLQRDRRLTRNEALAQTGADMSYPGAMHRPPHRYRVIPPGEAGTVPFIWEPFDYWHLQRVVFDPPSATQ